MDVPFIRKMIRCATPEAKYRPEKMCIWKNQNSDEGTEYFEARGVCTTTKLSTCSQVLPSELLYKILELKLGALLAS
ncbi:MAG: hypothetical protein ACRYE9_02010 [Janthinobacterium lividum]